MRDRPNRSARSVPPSGQPRAPQRGRGRAQPPRQNTRNRQLLAVGALVLVLAVVVAAVILSQQNQQAVSSGGLPGEERGHARGSATAQVVLTEWSDFQ